MITFIKAIANLESLTIELSSVFPFTADSIEQHITVNVALKHLTQKDFKGFPFSGIIPAFK